MALFKPQRQQRSFFDTQIYDRLIATVYDLKVLAQVLSGPPGEMCPNCCK